MSTKSLLRYRSAVGGDDLLSPAPGDKKSSGESEQDKGHSGNRLEEDDSFDEGIDDILAQVGSLLLTPLVEIAIIVSRHVLIHHYLDFYLSHDLLIDLIHLQSL